MDPVDRLVAGSCVAMALEGRAARAGLRLVERELVEEERTVVWVDMDRVNSGGELGGRIVAACLPFLDVDELGDLLEGLPARGRVDLDMLAELLMLPERVAEEVGQKVVAIFDGFQSLERVAGMPAVMLMADVLMARSAVTYLFVGNARVPALFTRERSPLHGLAEVVEVSDREESSRVEPPSDPLAAALLSWAEPPRRR